MRPKDQVTAIRSFWRSLQDVAGTILSERDSVGRKMGRRLHLRSQHRRARKEKDREARKLIYLRSNLDGVLAWTRLRLSNGTVEGMNNKIKLISHRAFGFRRARNFIAAIYHGCARLPLPPAEASPV
jgi:hypothetical protein